MRRRRLGGVIETCSKKAIGMVSACICDKVEEAKLKKVMHIKR